ncbi:hypothetical protein PoB_000720500 [Plakobranchus ocellatus]|uniref:Uncharacterized protein n=1 Tax=Plakobranchus ocellatus TaxID=259542 RepID=A0AAV3YDC9_9GAST|nr:hypothetical protein PoB_000720500 [Plakobranchus ocellatus]
MHHDGLCKTFHAAYVAVGDDCLHGYVPQHRCQGGFTSYWTTNTLRTREKGEGRGGQFLLFYWLMHIASPQQGDLRLSGSPSGQSAGGGARTRDRRVPADLRTDSLAINMT